MIKQSIDNFTLMKVMVLVCFVILSKAQLPDDGMWTDNDWEDTAIGFAVINGVVYGLTAETQAELDSTEMNMNSLSISYLNMVNVQRIRNVLEGV